MRRVEPSGFTKISALGVEEQRVNVVIRLSEPRDRWMALGDGYRVEARIIVWEEEGVLIVPSSAVFRYEDGWAVFVVEEDVVVLTDVDVGRRNGIDVQITGGLSAGKRVVVHPSDRVVDGAEVVAR